ncbi:MAG: hypothetical protein ABFR47_00475 [Verrucomicrobiota bacterium]
MPAKRRYNVKGTKDFLVLAGIFFFLCLWAVKDAWFPSEGVLGKHPKSVEVSFAEGGVIKEFHVSVGDSISTPKDGHEPTLLATLNDSALKRKFNSRKEAYAALDGGSPEKKALLEEIGQLKVQLEKFELFCPELGKEKGGKVSKMLVNRYSQVNAGEPVMVIMPNQGFYLFNKSLTIISFIAFFIFLGIHILAQ